VFSPWAIGSRLPHGFVQEVVASHLNAPTSFVFLPGGRILIGELGGIVRMAGRRAPFLDIRSRVNAVNERGLLAIAVDPDFARRPFLYVYYAYENDPRSPDTAKSMRLSRFTVRGGRALPRSESVILGRQSRGDCNLLPRGADCIPANCKCHLGGGLAFSNAGDIYLSTGDAANAGEANANGLRPQDLDSLAGKLLRVTRRGVGVPGNPYFAGRGRSNRSKVFAYGFRNPFRFTLRLGSGVPYVGDVGWQSWEELDVAHAGGNYGWPCYEGPERQLRYGRFEVCRRLYSHHPGLRKPLFSYRHPRKGASIIGGVFYRGSYVFGDYVQGWIRTLRHGRAVPFLTGAAGPVEIATGPDGSLYYLAIKAGQLRRVRPVS
jgi:glucose/arabinose dehydrogenase